MPREFTRSDRVADALQRELAQLIRDEMDDPRLGIVNITEVQVSRDMSQAKVYVNFVVPKSDDEAAAAMDVLNGAAGFLRAQLAKAIRMRSIPQAAFLLRQQWREGPEAVGPDRPRGVPGPGPPRRGRKPPRR